MMVANMDPAIRFLFLASCLLSVEKSVGSVGPVFVNPSSASVAVPNIQTAKGNYVTQTVYGFLDFTTTIGNTVMVFSPQSAAAATEEKRKSDASNSVIETKPVTEENKNSAIIIKPSRTQFSAENAPSELSSPRKISSIVQVQSNPPVVFSSEIEIKPFPPSSLNVIEGVSSVVNTASSGPIFSSIVEIIPPPQQNAIKKVEPQNNKEKEQQQQQQPFILSSHVEIYTGPSLSSVPQPPLNQPPILSSIVEVHSDETPAVVVGNNIGEPEYDFLSRQPSEVVEETYKVINLKPSSKFHLKPRASLDAKNNLNPQTKRADSIHPTGLVTKLGGTVVKDGITTVHETSVIGTYISGKYAQVLQSTSHIVNNNHQKGKINPSPSLRILKTAAPSLGKGNKHHRHLDPTPAGSVNEETALPVEAAFNSQNSIKSTRKPTATGGSFKPRFKNRMRDQEVERDEGDHEVHQNKKKTTRLRPSQLARNSKQHTPPHRPPKYGRSSKTTTVSVHSEDTTPPSTFGNGKRYQSRKNKQRDYTAPTENINNNNNSGYSRRGYKPRVQTSTVEQISASTSLYKFKLNRSPGRWQYKTTPKPRVTIRKQQNSGDDDQNAAPGGGGTTPSYPQDAVPSLNDVVTPQARSDDVDSLVGSESIASIIDDESSTENKLDTPLPLETIKVEISTPADFKDVYYEIATIKSPYTFQVGSVKNTRYITVTSTFEKSLATTADGNISPSASEPLTENILATSSNYAKDNNFLDSSIATLPPLYLASDMETPPLETLVETFSTTQTMLKTHILPIVRGGNDTSISTLVQTYLVTRIVTASKTLPPMEAYHFIPSKTLNEFNSHLDEAGSELHLELEFGDENDQDDGARAKKVFPPDLDLAKVGSDFDLSDVDKSKLPEALLKLKKAQTTTTPKPPMEPVPTPALSPEQLQQLALLRLLNPAAAPPTPQQVVTTSKPIVKVETVYESHVIPVFNGASTILSTISKIIGTVTKTDYEFGTSTVPALPLPPVPVNPLFPQPQPQFAVTSSPVVQSTVITQTDSKILKLTFGAKTAYTTIFSTKIVPTVLTTYMTASVPVQPTAAFPGFFPAPYPAFPYVG